MLCRVAATSHEDLQRSLLDLDRSSAVVRSTSVIALTEVVAPRYLPLLRSVSRPAARRAPAYRRPSTA